MQTKNDKTSPTPKKYVLCLASDPFLLNPDLANLVSAYFAVHDGFDPLPALHLLDVRLNVHRPLGFVILKKKKMFELGK